MTELQLQSLPRLQLESMARERRIVNYEQLTDEQLADAIHVYDRL